MLNRLVAKGILQRILSNRSFVYLPALTSNDSRTMALKRFADDYFAGSVQRAAATMRALLDSRR
jgi:predicted transcriptional regulator